MELDKRWVWRSHRLPRRVRVESGNPDVDDLVQTLQRLVGVDDAPAFLAGSSVPEAALPPPASARKARGGKGATRGGADAGAAIAARAQLSSAASSRSVSSSRGSSAGSSARPKRPETGGDGVAAAAPTEAKAAMVPPAPPVIHHPDTPEAALRRKISANLQLFGDRYRQYQYQAQQAPAPSSSSSSSRRAASAGAGAVVASTLPAMGHRSDSLGTDVDAAVPMDPPTVATASLSPAASPRHAAAAAVAAGSASSSAPSTPRTPLHRRNVHKTYIEAPKSPPRRVLYDLKMEAALAIQGAASASSASPARGGGLDDPHEEHDDGARDARGAAAGGSSPGRLMMMGTMRLPPASPPRWTNDRELLHRTASGSTTTTQPPQAAAKPPPLPDLPVQRKEPARALSPVPEASAASTPTPPTSPLPSEAAAAKQQLQQQPQANGASPTPTSASTPATTAATATAAATTSSAKDVEAKLLCAQRLCDWAAHDGNTERLYKEGAVEAMMRLSKEPDPLIHRYCARAFRRMAAREVLAKEMLALGGIVQLISELLHPPSPKGGSSASTSVAAVASTTPMRGTGRGKALAAAATTSSSSRSSHPPVPRQIVTDCLAALLDLTTVVGSEVQLVEDGIVVALVSLLKNEERRDEMCARGLFNLTCVSSPYPFMERVVKALMTLASSAFPSVQHLCASALRNLAAHKSMRLRLVEEGVIQALSSLIRGGGDATTRRLCATILHTLSSSKPVRAEMVSRGAIALLHTLSSDPDEASLLRVASTLLRFTAEEASFLRLTTDGGVAALGRIACRCAGVGSIAHACAKALYALSQRPDLHAAMFQGRQQQPQQQPQAASPPPEQHQHHADSSSSSHEAAGALPALMAMLRTSLDYSTLRFSTLTLCNLLAQEDNHAHLHEGDALPTLVHLCRHAGFKHRDIQASCAHAVYTLVRHRDEARAEAAACGAIPVLVAMVKDHPPVPVTTAAAGRSGGREQQQQENHQQQQQQQQRRRRQLQLFGSATLCLLAGDAANLGAMLEEGALPTFIHLLHSPDVDTVRYSCAAICHFAADGGACLQLIHEGAVPPVVRGATRAGEPAIQQACGAVLAAMSAHAESRRLLCLRHPEVLAAVTALAAMDDEPTRLRCAATLAHLSCEPLAHPLMVQQGAVPVLAELSNSYSEENQLHCAKALCNLACRDGSEAAIVEQGGLAALMMIGMVRAVNLPTKRTVSMALLNLLTPGTLARATAEGIMTACANLSKLHDEAVMDACARIFLLLSTEPGARRQLVEKAAALHALTHLMRSRRLRTKVVVSRAVCNLLAFEDSRELAMRDGALGVLREVAELPPVVVDEEEGEAQPQPAQGGGHRNGDSSDGDAVRQLEAYAIETLFHLCRVPGYRRQLLDAEMVPVVLNLARRADGGPSRNLCIRMVSLLLWHAQARPAFMAHGGLPLLLRAISDHVGSDRDMEEKRVVVGLCLRACVYLGQEAGHHAPLLGGPGDGGMLAALYQLHAHGYFTPATYEMVALLLRQLSSGAGRSGGGDEAARIPLRLLETGGLQLLLAIVTAVPHHQDVLLTCATTLHHLLSEREALTAVLAMDRPPQDEHGIQGGYLATLEELLLTLGDKPSCQPLLSAMLASLSLGAGPQPPLAQMASMPALLHKLLLLDDDDDDDDGHGGDGATFATGKGGNDRNSSSNHGPEASPSSSIQQNACVAALMLAKASPECRLRLQHAGLIPVLLRLFRTATAAAVVELASKALHQLSTSCPASMELSSASAGAAASSSSSDVVRSDSADTVKEGTVAALIATALESPNTLDTEGWRPDGYVAVPPLEPIDVLRHAPEEDASKGQPPRGPSPPAVALPRKIPAGPGGGVPDPPKLPSIAFQSFRPAPQVEGKGEAVTRGGSILEAKEEDYEDDDGRGRGHQHQQHQRWAVGGSLGLELLEDPPLPMGAAPRKGWELEEEEEDVLTAAALDAAREARAVAVSFRTDEAPAPTGQPRPAPRGRAGNERRRFQSFRASFMAPSYPSHSHQPQPQPQPHQPASTATAAPAAATATSVAAPSTPAPAPTPAPSPYAVALKHSPSLDKPGSAATASKRGGSTANKRPSKNGKRASGGNGRASGYAHGAADQPAAPSGAGALSPINVDGSSSLGGDLASRDEDGLIQLRSPRPIDHGPKTRLPDYFGEQEDAAQPPRVLTFHMRYPHKFAGQGSGGAAATTEAAAAAAGVAAAAAAMAAEAVSREGK